MKNALHKLIFVALILVICLTFTNCSNDETESTVTSTKQNSNLDTEQDNTTQEDNDYSIIVENGKCYIVFEEPHKYEDSFASEMASLTFASIDEMKETVTEGKLTEGQKRVIATVFKKDDNGKVLVCDFDKLYEPSLPVNFSVEAVVWSGESYSFCVSEKTGMLGFVNFYTEVQYEKILESDYERFFEESAIKVSGSTVTDENKTVIDFSTDVGEFKKIRYEIARDNGRIIVDETYRLKVENSSLGYSDTVPINVTLYCENDGIYFVVDLYELTESVTNEWLLQFDMHLYSENNGVNNDEEPPAQQYTTYYLDNYEELIKSFSKDNSESEIQKDKANHSPEFAAFVDKLVEEESLVLPYISDELLPLRNLEGFPNLIVWESEAFERPWIWFFGEYEGKRFRVMLTSVDDVENAQSLDGMEILGQIAPDVDWKSETEGFYYSSVEQVQLKNEDVKAAVLKSETTGLTVYFYYNGFFVRINTEYDVSDTWLWSLFSLEKPKAE